MRRAASALVLVLAAAGSARAGDEFTPETLKTIDAWEKGDEKAGAALLASPQRDAVADYLAASLAWGDHPQHRRALALLGRFEDRRGDLVLPLLRAAAHDSENCHLAAVEAVLLLPDAVAKRFERPLVGVLAGFVASRRDELARPAARALEKLTGEKLGPDAAAWGQRWQKESGRGLDPATTRLEAPGDAYRIAVETAESLPQERERARAILAALHDAPASSDLGKEVAGADAFAKELAAAGGFERRLLADAVSHLAWSRKETRASELRRAEYQASLEVSAIVVDPRPASRNRAIIHYKGVVRIYEEGDPVRDKDDRRLEGLKVLKIQEGSVTFSVDGDPLLVALRQPDGR
jgi:hypothetical protein